MEISPSSRLACLSPLCSRCNGFGLIEILIALVITAIGLLGMASLQGKAQLAEMESYQRAQALILLQDMAGRLRANRAGRAAYLTQVGYGSSFNDTASCGNPSGKTQAEVDLSCWHNALLGAAEISSGGTTVGAMLGGHGCIVDDDADDSDPRLEGLGFIVSVSWQGLNDISVSGTDARSVSSCGTGLYGSESRRRVISIPVRFINVNPDIGGGS